MKPHHVFPLLLLAVLHSSALRAVNILTVQDLSVYGSKPGYIDEAVLVVEPHGSHVEQSLYLNYSDHWAYTPNKPLEIVHRFELPSDAVVNDLWLWIGDSVMQAIIIDTWTARAIYDSIVSVKRDPVFLVKNGSEYEMHIYPLLSGSFRKIKMNFVAPTRWVGDQASVELPLAMLKANNSAVKPLKVLFRTREAEWGEPRIQEFPNLAFTALPDSMNYHFQYGYIPGLTALSQLTMTFSTQFEKGAFFTANQKLQEPLYFQIGIHPETFFGLEATTKARKTFIAADLGDAYERDMPAFTDHIGALMRSALATKDQFRLAVAGADTVQFFTTGWPSASPEKIVQAVADFAVSPMAAKLTQTTLPQILYADRHASLCWQFPGLNAQAIWTTKDNISQALPLFSQADVVAAYDHGYDNRIGTEDAARIIPALDSLFLRGGRFLTFYDYNRIGHELLATHYIPGLTTGTWGPCTLFRNPNGNIGYAFPASIYHPVVNRLEYQADPEVKIELMDDQGRPAVISKKIQNGLLVVSGIWSYKDDGALRATLGIPLLGLNQSQTSSQLQPLLAVCQSEFAAQPFDKMILLSNSSTVIGKADAAQWIHDYLQPFGEEPPVINTINLLEGLFITPPYLTEKNVDYFGSGLFASLLSDSTFGLHFETHLQDWDYIISLLDSRTPPRCENIQLTVQTDQGAHTLLDLREIGANRNDAKKPLFFIGAATGENQVQVDISASFAGLSLPFNKSLTIPAAHDTSQRGQIIYSMLGYETLKDLLENSPKDTAAIVTLAVNYRLLCDYTSFIALEPDEKHHFLKNPFDEGQMVTVEEKEEDKADSLRFDIYPNPFNEKTTIQLKAPAGGTVTLKIFNLRGQVVKEFSVGPASSATRRFVWDGRDEAERQVCSGIYFVQMVIQGGQSGMPQQHIKRVLLLR